MASRMNRRSRIKNQEQELESIMISRASTSSLPSRYNNPFATCWTRPGVLAFRFPAGQSAEKLITQLAAQGWCGAIIGPHGSGKTTLLATLRPLLSVVGRGVHVVDGYEQLGRLARWQVRRHCRRNGTGLLVTSHRPTGLPTLIELKPSRRLIDGLVADLCDEIASPITPAHVAACYARRGGNVREMLFDLYDRHERLCRPAPVPIS